MKETSSTPSCEWSNDLMAVLYAEADEIEAKKFEHHLERCIVCQSEFAAFSHVRESVLAWRNESLNPLPATDPVVVAPIVVGSARQEKPSAIAAIREFFHLSPLWMKGAVGFASVLFCLFSVLALAHLFEKPETVAGSKPSSSVPSEKLYTAEELRVAVEKGVQEATARLRSTPEETGTVAANKFPSREKSANPGWRANQLAKSTQQQSQRRRPLTREERNQLATDLRLITSKDEDDLDFLDDRLNK